MMAKLDDLRIEEPAPGPAPRRRHLRVVLLGLAVVVLLVLAGTAWRLAGSGKTGASSGPARVDETAVTAVLPPGDGRAGAAAATASLSGTRPGVLTAGGYVEIIPPGPTVVAARVSGWMQTIEVIEGMTVAAGQTLATIDDTVHRQSLAEAEAEVHLARAQLARLRAGFRDEEIADAGARQEQATARADFARSEVQRLDRLVAIGAATERQLRAARAALAEAEADLASADARLGLHLAGSRPEDIAVAEAALAQAVTRQERLRWQVEQCVVRAPIDGVVLERFVRVGDWIAPAESGGRQGAVLTLFDPDRLQVWVDVNQRDAEQVAAGQQVLLRTDAGRDRPIPGRVAAIMPKANLQRNTVEVKIEILSGATGATGEAAPRLRPEMSVQVTFLASPGAPPQAPQPEGGRP